MDQGVFEKYLDDILRRVRFKDAHFDIRRELISHAEEIRNQIRNSGISESALEAQIVQRMGNAQEIGKELDKVHQPRMDWVLIALVSGLLTIGLYVMSQLGHLGLQSIWLCLGLIALVGCAWMKPNVLRRFSYPIYFSVLILGLVSYAMGSSYEGQPYLSFGPIHVKVVDLSAVILVLAFSGILQELQKKAFAKKAGALLACLLPLFAYVGIGSLYPAIVLISATVIMMLVSECGVLFVLTYSFAGAFTIAAALGKNQFVSGESMSKMIEAERHTDFVFCFTQSASPVLGAFLAALSLCLVILLPSRLTEIKNRFSRTLFSGAAAVLGVGTIWSLLSNVGFIPMPVTGVNYPFVSYGGSLLVAHMGLVGIALGLYRRKSIEIIG